MQRVGISSIGPSAWIRRSNIGNLVHFRYVRHLVVANDDVGRGTIWARPALQTGAAFRGKCDRFTNLCETGPIVSHHVAFGKFSVDVLVLEQILNDDWITHPKRVAHPTIV